jgi:hypothetical protein
MSNIIVDNKISETTIIVDENVTNLLPYRKLLRDLEQNYSKIENATNNIIANSSIYLNLEEVEEVNFIQTLTGKWIETAEEMDTIQQNFSGNWQQTTEYINQGVVDAGYF